MAEYAAQGWRMAGYYPGQYAKSMSALGIGIDYSDDDHDRYEAEFMADLSAHDAKVKADALREAADMVERLRPETGPQINVTQYRQGKADAAALAHAHLLAEADRIEKENP